MRDRPTNEPKQVNIKVRVTEEMKIYLEKSSEKCGMNISEYIRNMIAGDMRK